MIAPWKTKMTLTFLFGVARVVAFIGVGVISALVVLALKEGRPFEPLLPWLFVTAPLAGVLHWAESWLAHDVAFRLLAEMRIAIFDKLDRLAPARSEEHTSELQSLMRISYAVFCLKKKTIHIIYYMSTTKI